MLIKGPGVKDMQLSTVQYCSVSRVHKGDLPGAFVLAHFVATRNHMFFILQFCFSITHGLFTYHFFLVVYVVSGRR